jgi:predicted O-linked N-acetylglucosamine transferase (SPINDLY family)
VTRKISTGQLIAVAVAYQKQGRLADAEAVYRSVLQRDGEQADALYGLGLLALTKGDAAGSVRLIEQAIERSGERASTRYGLGCALAAAGRLDEAILAFTAAAQLDPNLAAVHHSLGRALAERVRPGAVASYRRALALEPAAPEIWNHLGVGYVAIGAADPAGAAYLRVLAVQPMHGDALLNHGADLVRRGRQADGLRVLRRALALSPAEGVHQQHYAIAASSLGEQAAGFDGFRRARALAPDNDEIYGNYLFFINHLPGFSFARHFAENRRWGRWVEARVTPADTFDHRPDPERRLRIAYVSPELVANHNQLSWLMPLLLNHDRAQFEICCYGDVPRPDRGTAEVAGLSDIYRSIHGLPEAEQARIVRMDRIDIAVNLCGWLAAKRSLFAWRLAPIQIAYDNHVTTTGLTAMDYRITDRWVDPPGIADPWYTERLIRLESGYASQLEPEAAPAIDALPAVRNGYLTFGSFNQLTKITNEAVTAWAGILDAASAARLLIKAPNLGQPGVQRYWRERFGRFGIGAERLIFVGALPDLADHYRAIARADIALDPFPFTGGKSTCDALWMGVPVVTLAGDCQIGRIGTSLLNRAGLGDLVAPDLGAYRRIAVDLAGDLGRLAAMRCDMRGQLKRHGLFDGKRHTAELEQALRALWVEWSKHRPKTSEP